MELSCGMPTWLREVSLDTAVSYVIPVSSDSNGCRLERPKWISFESRVQGFGRCRKAFKLNLHGGTRPCFAGLAVTRNMLSAVMMTKTKNDTHAGSGANNSRGKVELADVATGEVDVCGWKVLLKGNRELVGVVDEILHIGSADSDEIFESVLKLIYNPGLQRAGSARSFDTGDDEGDMEELEILVPLVKDIVREVDVKRKLLYISPPDGLLELARIPRLLRDLAPQLSEFCRQQRNGVMECLNTANATNNDRRRLSIAEAQVLTLMGEIESERFEMFMPTRRQLIASGRHDLVEAIMAAGGFLSVAHALQIPSRRRPNGFWDDLRNLDAEIEWFVSGSWIKEDDPETGETIYRNRATDGISRQIPTPGSVANPVPVSQSGSDEGTAVMPRQRNVLEAGRYDLHHAIVLHGGYKVVAQVLGRQSPSKDTTSRFVSKMKTFMEEQSFTHLPSLSELRAHGRNDLVHSLRRHGGLNGVAEAVDARPKRYGKGQWNQIEVAAGAIRSYICKKLVKERSLKPSLSMNKSDLEDKVWNDALRAGILEVPSQTSLLRDQRADLRYLLQKFGRRNLSEYLGIPLAQGSQRRTSPMMMSSMQKLVFSEL